MLEPHPRASPRGAPHAHESRAGSCSSGPVSPSPLSLRRGSHGLTPREPPLPQEGLRWRVGVLCARSPVPQPPSASGPQVWARTHLAIPDDEQLPVEGDVVVPELQQRQQLRAPEQRKGTSGERGSRSKNARLQL